MLPSSLISGDGSSAAVRAFVLSRNEHRIAMANLAEIYQAAALYLLFINAVTYVAFWIDKAQARNGGYRISENNLLLLSTMGGSPSALVARSYLRHKTRKQPFVKLLFLIVAVQCGAIASLLFAWATA